jgi:uncharacterized membrane protein
LKILTKISSILAILSILSLVVLPVVTNAVTEPGERPGEALREAAGVAGVETERSLPEFVGTIIKWVIGLIGVVLVALFVYGGVVYATSAGNEDRIEMGKKIMMYAVIGVAIIAFAFLITDYIISALFPEG